MKINTFEDIVVWQKARVLTLRIYTVFGACKDYSFRDQIQRASVSVMNNIAEGYERGTNAEFRRFLFISKGSCGEVRSLLLLGLPLKYLSQDNFDELHATSIEISRMLSAFIKKL